MTRYDWDVAFCGIAIFIIGALMVACMYVPMWWVNKGHRAYVKAGDLALRASRRRLEREEEKEKEDTPAQLAITPGSLVGPDSFTYVEGGVEHTVVRGTEIYNQIHGTTKRS